MTCRADPSPSDQSPLALVAQESCDKPVREKQYVACTSGAEVFGHPVPNFRNRENTSRLLFKKNTFCVSPSPHLRLWGKPGWTEGLSVVFTCVLNRE